MGFGDKSIESGRFESSFGNEVVEINKGLLCLFLATEVEGIGDFESLSELPSSIQNFNGKYMMMMKKSLLGYFKRSLIITIDGKSGSGKSSTSKEIAKKLNFQYIDTGAFYRCLTYYFVEKGINESEYQNYLKSIKIQTTQDKKYLLNDQDITNEIRTKEISQKVSLIATFKEIRDFVNELIKSQVKYHENIVIDGRHIGSKLFPEAEVKFFFVTNNNKVRSQRRLLELVKAGNDLSEQEREKLRIEIENDLITRDEIDTKRVISPLIQPKGSILIDTSNLTFEHQVDIVMSKINEKIESLKKV
jgi:cytidylate kinase